MPTTLVWGPQNPQIIQIWHTLCPFTECAMRIASRKHGPHQWLSGRDALFCGEHALPPRKFRTVVTACPPLQGPRTAPILCFLSKNARLTMCLHKVCFSTECLLYLLYDHTRKIQKNFVQNLANFLLLSLSLSFSPLQPLFNCQKGTSLISQTDGIV